MVALPLMEKLKGGIIGFGFIASKGHAPAYLERKDRDVLINAIADLSPQRRALAKTLFPHAHIYETAESLIENEKELDFIDIATPPYQHAPIATLALKRGLHVLCEKPLTTTQEMAKALLTLAESKKRVLFPCHTYKHAPVVKEIDQILSSGKIGPVHSVSLITLRNTHAKGVSDWQTDWRRHNSYSGGGIAMDHGSHSFYLTFDWLRSLPTKITAKMTNSDPKYDTEDNFSAVLTFPTGLANIQLSWVAGVRKVIYALQGKWGAITIDDDEMQVATMREHRESQMNIGNIQWDVHKKTISSDWMDSSHVGWFHSLFDSFKKAIQHSDFRSQEILQALACVQLIETAYRSSKLECRELEIS